MCRANSRNAWAPPEAGRLPTRITSRAAGAPAADTKFYDDGELAVWGQVNPGVVETRARSGLPESMFSREDLPTFERPMKANSGSDSSGHESRSGALRSKMADVIFTK